MWSPQFSIRLKHFNPQEAQLCHRECEKSRFQPSLRVKGSGLAQISSRQSEVARRSLKWNPVCPLERTLLAPGWAASCSGHSVPITFPAAQGTVSPPSPAHPEHTEGSRGHSSLPLPQLRKNHPMIWPQLFPSARGNEHNCPCSHKTFGSLFF